MKRIILMLTVAAFMVAAMAVTAPLAFAAPPCPAGSDTDRAVSNGQGSFSCTTTTPSEKNDKFTKTQTTTTKGSSGPNEVAGPTTCQGTGSGKCPPGQF
jgi:hypothetical protein